MNGVDAPLHIFTEKRNRIGPGRPTTHAVEAKRLRLQDEAEAEAAEKTSKSHTLNTKSTTLQLPSAPSQQASPQVTCPKALKALVVPMQRIDRIMVDPGRAARECNLRCYVAAALPLAKVMESEMLVHWPLVAE